MAQEARAVAASESGGASDLAVVIPTHDTRELTLACLASLERSQPRPAAVVLVDDGSNDGTAAAVAERFPQVRVLRNERAEGFSRAANRGLRAIADRPLLLLLNSDTEVEAGALAALGAAFTAAPRLGIAGAALLDPDGKPQWSGGRAPGTRWLFLASSGLGPLLARLLRRHRQATTRHGRPVDWVTGAALAMRREVWEACGPLEERFAFYAQDLDLCLRAGEAGWQVGIVPEARVLHYHGASVSASGRRPRQDHARLWPDLALWADLALDAPTARRARRALRWGVSLRCAVLRLSGLLPASAARRRHRATAQDALRRARRALATHGRPAPAVPPAGPPPGA